MPNVKISELPAASTPLTGAELVPVVQGGVTEQVSVADLTAGRAVSASDVTATNLSASQAVLTDANKKLVSQATTGTGNVVRATSPALTTPNLGTPSAVTLTNATGLPISTGVTGLGTGVATALAVNTGTAGSVVVNGGALGTPSSGTLTSCTGLPLTTGVTGTLPVANGGTGITSFGAGVATWLGTPSSANLAAAVTDETGSGALVFATNPTLAGATVATGDVVIGVAASFATAKVQHAGDSTAGATSSIIRRFSNDASAPLFILSKSRGTTASATTAVQNGDLLGSIFWQAADGSTFANTAKIAAAIEGSPSAGSLPTSLEFLTTPSGSTTALQRLRILPTGGIASSNLADAVGYKGTPLNEQSVNYTLVIEDMGKSIVHPASDNNARTFTIPANGTVAFPVGTTITFINMINTVTIAITTDTMYLAGAGTTGSRTLAAYGMATAVKVTSTSWIISGNGLT